MRSCLAMSLALAAAVSSLAAPVDLLKTAAARPVIVYSDAPVGAYEYAARTLLQRTLRDIVPAEPLLIPESKATPEPGQIWLGACKLTAKDFAKELEGLDNDGFFVAARAGMLFVSGPHRGTGHGTLNGAVDFLKRDLGCRWYLPGEFGSVIPRRAALALEVADRRVEPAFRARTFYCTEDSWKAGDTELWLNANRRHIRLQFHHNMHRVLPPSRFGKEHPEWYCELGGLRRPPLQDTTSAWQPCMTNADGIKAAADVIIEHFRKNPAEMSFSIGVNDGGGYCECAACKAKYLEGAAKEECGLYGRLFFEWADGVAKIVEKEFPDRLLGCLSYGGAYVPPAELKISRIIVPLAVMPTFRAQDPEMRAEQDRRARNLSERCGAWGLYDWFYGYGMVFPLPIHHLLQERLRTYHGLGARAIYYENYPNWALDGWKYALMNDLLWDPALDVDAWLAEFYTVFFGAAAGPMKEYDRLWEAAWAARTPAMGRPSPFAEAAYAHITPDLYARSFALLEEALKKADTPLARQRVLFVRAGLRGSEVFLRRLWAARDGEAAMAANDAPKAFAALAPLQSPEIDYARYTREVLDLFPTRALQRPTYHMDLMAAGAARAQNQLYRSIEKALGRPEALLRGDLGDPAAVQKLLDAFTPGRGATRDEGALRERLRDMLTRVALVRRAARPPQIDGLAEDPCWSEAQVLGDFVKLPAAASALYRTEVRFAYDDRALYAAFTAFQDRKSLWRESDGSRDGRIWNDDAVELFLNRPDAAGKKYVQIIVNPWGAIFDMYDGNAKFNADLTLKTAILEDRFVVEMAIPWASLPEMSPKDRLLRLNIQRGKCSKAAYEEVSDWFPASDATHLDSRGWMVLMP
jgi:hypothetical protein